MREILFLGMLGILAMTAQVLIFTVIGTVIRFFAGEDEDA